MLTPLALTPALPCSLYGWSDSSSWACLPLCGMGTGLCAQCPACGVLWRGSASSRCSNTEVRLGILEICYLLSLEKERKFLMNQGV